MSSDESESGDFISDAASGDEVRSVWSGDSEERSSSDSDQPEAKRVKFDFDLEKQLTCFPSFFFGGCALIREEVSDPWGVRTY